MIGGMAGPGIAIGPMGGGVLITGHGGGGMIVGGPGGIPLMIGTPRGRGHVVGNRRQRLANGEVVTGYHQTDEAGKRGILANGFRRGGSGLAGGGIYFARTPGETERKAHHKGYIFEARVKMGRTKHVNGGDGGITYDRLQREGYDSVTIHGRASGIEYVVYNRDQVQIVRVFSA